MFLIWQNWRSIVSKNNCSFSWYHLSIINVRGSERAIWIFKCSVTYKYPWQGEIDVSLVMNFNCSGSRFGGFGIIVLRVFSGNILESQIPVTFEYKWEFLSSSVLTVAFSCFTGFDIIIPYDSDWDIWMFERSVTIKHPWQGWNRRSSRLEL